MATDFTIKKVKAGNRVTTIAHPYDNPFRVGGIIILAGDSKRAKVTIVAIKEGTGEGEAATVKLTVEAAKESAVK